MIFKNRETGRPSLWITSYNLSWQDQDASYLYRIRSFEDLPLTEDVAHLYSQLDIPIEIWKEQGRIGIYSYLREFFMNDWCHAKDKGASKRELKELAKKAKEEASDFWFMFLPSGFPKDIFPELKNN